MPRPAPVISATCPSRRNERGKLDSAGLLMTALPGRAETYIPATVTAQANIRLFLVRPEPFDGTEPRTIFTDEHARLFGAFLVGDGFQEFSDPKPACIARRASGRESVIRANHFVPIGHVCFGAKKHRAVISHVIEKIPRFAGQDLDVLVREPVTFSNGFGKILTKMIWP